MHKHEFHLKDLDQLRAEIARMDLDISLDDDLSVLSERLIIGETSVPNRLCVQPMEGCDAQPDGSPGRLTFRRYMRYAEGGFGLIWLEAMAVQSVARSRPTQLQINRANVGAFTDFVATIRKTARDRFDRDVVIVAQLTHAGPYSRPSGTPRPHIVHHNPDLNSKLGIAENYPLVTDDELGEIQDAYVVAARLAAEAGFDGVDVKSCHSDLISGLLAAFTRDGKYGGTFDNRTRFLLEVLTRIHEEIPALLLSTRMSGYDAVRYPYGFGVAQDDDLTPDPSEPIELARRLQNSGVSLLNVSTGIPFLGTTLGRPASNEKEIGQSEHPLVRFVQISKVTGAIQKACPELPVIGAAYSWFRHLMPYVAASALGRGEIAMVGLGRGALAYPDLAADILEAGEMTPTKCCITCSACIQLLQDDGATGCVIKDKEFYGAEYRNKRHFAIDNLVLEAQRCHQCEAADCTAACPTGIDVPAFIKAFADDDIEAAYATISDANVLPEMCSHLCPVWMMCEGACLEGTLNGSPIPIRDIQYMVCWMARERGLTGVSMSRKQSGRRVAIVGGGPTGVACAARLVEKGHRVTIFERAESLGGTPEQVIPERRLRAARAEVDALLQPAIDGGSLDVLFGKELGKDVSLDDLRDQYDAILLATGLWKELSLGQAEGVVDALSFLKQVKSGELQTVPQRVAVLSGGDCAMDAASSAKELGAADLYVIYGGSFADMHWHMQDDWFRVNCAHCMTLTDPVGYEVDENNRLTGVRICRMAPGTPDSSGRCVPGPVPDTESVLKVDMVIEAMGLGMADDLRHAIDGIAITDTGLAGTTADDTFATGIDKVFAAGGLVNGGASVVQCIAEGMRVAGEIDEFV